MSKRRGFFFGSLCNFHLPKASRGHHRGQGDAAGDSTVCCSFAWPSASVQLFVVDVGRRLYFYVLKLVPAVFSAKIFKTETMILQALP